MRAVVTIDVPDEFLQERVAEHEQSDWLDDRCQRCNYKISAPTFVVGQRCPRCGTAQTEAPTPQDYFRTRIEDIADDELQVALFGWPISTAVEIHGWFPTPDPLPDGLESAYVGVDEMTDQQVEEHGRPQEDVVLGHCPHGVDLDREMCEHGCRV